MVLTTLLLQANLMLLPKTYTILMLVKSTALQSMPQLMSQFTTLPHITQLQSTMLLHITQLQFTTLRFMLQCITQHQLTSQLQYITPIQLHHTPFNPQLQ